MRIRRRRLRDALVAVGCVVAAVDPFGAPAGRARFAAALVLLVAGSCLHFWSKGCLEQNQRLVTAGPYRFTRNPFYLANLLIDLALCALIGRVWVAVPFLVLWALAYRDTIRREETRLAELFPVEFEAYAARVPRLIPSGRSLPRGEAAGRFSLDNPALAQGGEYARILGVWVAAATIVAWDWIRGYGLAIFAPEQTAGLGLVALVPVVWVWKLAIAELFRSPETALMPFSTEPGRRRVVTFALVAALYVATRFLDVSPPSATSTVAFLLMAILLAVLPTANGVPSRRGILHAGIAVAIGFFAASRGILWLGSGAILAVGLAALDDAALVRLASGKGGRDVPPVDRVLWPIFRPVAILAIVAAAGLAVLRRVM